MTGRTFPMFAQPVFETVIRPRKTHAFQKLCALPRRLKHDPRHDQRCAAPVGNQEVAILAKRPANFTERLPQADGGFFGIAVRPEPFMQPETSAPLAVAGRKQRDQGLRLGAFRSDIAPVRGPKIETAIKV